MHTLIKIWSATWRILLFFCGWAALTSALVVPVVKANAQRGSVLPPLLRLYVEGASLITVLAAAWLMVRFIDRRPFVSLGFRKGYAARDCLAGFVIGCAMMATCIASMSICGWVTRTGSPSVLFAWPVAIAIIAMLLNTITQEVLVRGYVQQTIQQWFGKVVAVVASSTIFLLLHAGAIRGALLPGLSLFAAGLLLATCYAVTQNLWLPIALHFGWNVLQGPVLGGAVSGQSLDAGNHLLAIGGPTLMTGGQFGVEGGLIAITVTALATPLIVLLYKSRLRMQER